jgi:flagellar basal body-associated protein FliL
MKKILMPVGILLVALIIGFEVYSKVINPPKVPKLKIPGTLYVLPSGFTLNLSGGQYATLTVALQLAPTQAVGVTSATNPPPTGFGSLTDEAVIRAIITNDVTDKPESALLTQRGRKALEAEILSNINSQTDTKVTTVYFSNLAVQ